MQMNDGDVPVVIKYLKDIDIKDIHMQMICK